MPPTQARVRDPTGKMKILNQILVFVILLGLSFAISAMIVSVGESDNWPGFSSLGGGFWGTQFLTGFLYALGNPKARYVVIFIWTFYLLIPMLFLYFIASLTSKKKRLK